MKKLIDGMQALGLRNAIAILQDFGLAHMNLTSGLMGSGDTYHIAVPSLSIVVKPTDKKNQFEMEATKVGMEPLPHSSGIKGEDDA